MAAAGPVQRGRRARSKPSLGTPLENQLVAVKRVADFPECRREECGITRRWGSQPHSPLPMIFKHDLPDDYLFAFVLLTPVEIGGLRKRELKKKDSPVLL